MQYVYVLRNRLTGTFTNPMIKEGDKEQCIRGFTTGVLVDPEAAFKDHLDICELAYLGTYDSGKARFDLLPEPEILIDLGPIFEQAKARIDNYGSPKAN